MKAQTKGEQGQVKMEAENDTPKSQRMTEITGSYQNLLEEKHVAGSPSELPEGTNLLTPSNFKLLEL